MRAQSPMASFDIMIQRLTSTFVMRWGQIPDSVPDLGKRFTPRQQFDNEKKFQSQLQELPTSWNDYEGVSESGRLRIQARMKKAITALPLFPQDAFKNRFFEDSEAVTRLFIGAARDFDPSISDDSILQALRNLWVFNSIQMIFERPASLTPSSIAYSLLYPYSDNGLDSGVGSDDEKAVGLDWLSRWFEGAESAVPDRWTEKIARLLHMIEKEFPRPDFPDLYYSLRAIHRAQCRSLVLHKAFTSADDASLLPITVEKGGTSVLVDGYLVDNRLSDARIEALFGFGALLQLADDLQDLEEDRKAGHWTPFQHALQHGRLDEATSRLLRFTRNCAVGLQELVADRTVPVRRLVEGSCTMLIAQAVARYREMYKPSFLQTLEQSLPLRLGYLREIKQNLARERVWQSKHIGAESACVVS